MYVLRILKKILTRIFATILDKNFAKIIDKNLGINSCQDLVTDSCQDSCQDHAKIPGFVPFLVVRVVSSDFLVYIPVLSIDWAIDSVLNDNYAEQIKFCLYLISIICIFT